VSSNGRFRLTRQDERDESLQWNEVDGFVVLLDSDMNEVVERQDGTFSWALTRGGAIYKITTTHEFDIHEKSITTWALART
jgi:hypothetical protein